MYTYRGLEDSGNTTFNAVVNIPCVVGVTLKLSRSEIMDLFHLSECSKTFAEHCPVAVGSPVPAKNWLSATVVVFPAFVLFVPFEA
jgi:hypothetical protein